MPGSSESGAVPNSSVTDPPVFVLLPQPPATTASARTAPRIPTKRSFLIADLSSLRCASRPTPSRWLLAFHLSLTRPYLAWPAPQDAGCRRHRLTRRHSLPWLVDAGAEAPFGRGLPAASPRWGSKCPRLPPGRWVEPGSQHAPSRAFQY